MRVTRFPSPLQDACATQDVESSFEPDAGMSGTQLPLWAEWAKALGPAFVSALAVLVSALSVSLSRQIGQWQAFVARETLRQNNFDRIFAIYTAFRELLVAIVEKKNVEAELRKANAARAASPFLLNAQLGEYLKELHKEAFRLSANENLLAKNKGYQASLTHEQLAEEGAQLGRDKLRLANRVPELAKQFEPFLKPEDFNIHTARFSWRRKR